MVRTEYGYVVMAPCCGKARLFAKGARRTLQEIANNMQREIRMIWEGFNPEQDDAIVFSAQEEEPEPDIYGQYSLSFRPTAEEVEQFIATMQAQGKIVTMLDISLPSPRFIRITSNQAWERNIGGGNWSVGDWLSSDKFNFIWRESMRPTQQMRINHEHTLWAMQDRLDPETGNISLHAYHYVCTAPNGDVRLYESDVRLLELPIGANEGEVHLVRMMISDRIENNPHAWEVLISSEV